MARTVLTLCSLFLLVWGVIVSSISAWTVVACPELSIVIAVLEVGALGVSTPNLSGLRPRQLGKVSYLAEDVAGAIVGKVLYFIVPSSDDRSPAAVAQSQVLTCRKSDMVTKLNMAK